MLINLRPSKFRKLRKEIPFIITFFVALTLPWLIRPATPKNGALERYLRSPGSTRPSLWLSKTPRVPFTGINGVEKK
jgi:hypothetical protein